ncbi:MAG: hypothetical protein GX895_11045, partial [Clostridiales bacterium]|nr:hypothetical protein [Clostridiales bacterium]
NTDNTEILKEPTAANTTNELYIPPTSSSIHTEQSPPSEAQQPTSDSSENDSSGSKSDSNNTTKPDNATDSGTSYDSSSSGEITTESASENGNPLH